MAFIRHAGKTKLISVPMTTSQTTTPGSLAIYSGGLVTLATSSSTPGIICGVFRKQILATDSDFASARNVLVEVPLEKNVEWEADTSSAVAGDVGREVDLTDSLTVNRGANAVNVCQIREVPSATKVIVVIKFSGSY